MPMPMRTRASRRVAAWAAVAVLACLTGCAERSEPQAGVAAPAQVAVAPPPAVAPDTVAATGTPATGEPAQGPVEPWLVAVAPADRLVISAEGLGPVRLGMALDEARRALPGAAFARGWDGDGIGFVDVTRNGIALMSLHADEADPDAGIEWSRPITYIQSFSPAAVTADGVAVGDLLADAEQAWGPVREITTSEIESRQYVQFARQPPWLDVRIDYTGDFPEGASRTTRYQDGARIMAFAIARREAGADSPQ